MSDSTTFSVDLPLPSQDSRPLPEIIAAHYGFPLAFHDLDGQRWYAIQDWIVGVAQSPEPRKFWQNLKNRLKRAGVELSPSWRQLPYLAGNRKRYQVDHITDQGLYQITQRMDANTGLRNAVLEYLARSGVVLDEMRINPDEAIDAAIEAYKRMGKSEKWIATRIQSKAMRLRFTTAFSASLREKPQPRHFAIITDEMRLGLWKRSTATLKTQLHLRKQDSLRDNMSGLALSYEQLAENLSAVEMEMSDGLRFEESRDIVRHNAEHVGEHAAQASERLGIDIPTDKPLLRKP